MINILLVEDDHLNRLLIEDVFDHEFQGQASLLIAESGEQALELVSAHGPEVILMDISLPGIDGLETARRIRQEASNQHTIIWALTAHDTEQHRQAAFAAGCQGFVAKPCDIRQLRKQLRAIVDDIHARAL